MTRKYFSGQGRVTPILPMSPEATEWRRAGRPDGPGRLQASLRGCNAEATRCNRAGDTAWAPRCSTGCTAGSAGPRRRNAQLRWAMRRQDPLHRIALKTERRFLLLDLSLALVQVKVADGAVEVERRFLHALEGLQIERPLVEDVFGLLTEGRGQRNDVADRVHGDVEHVPHAVAEREGRQQRQHQVAALLPAPHAERLPGVLVALLDAELILGDVSHARPSERGADEEARQLPAGAVQFALEHAVHESLRKADVVEAIMDDLLLSVPDDDVIALGRGLEHIHVQIIVVEREHRLVERLPRIVIPARLLVGLGDLLAGNDHLFQGLRFP